MCLSTYLKMQGQKARGDNMSILAGIATVMIAITLLSVVALLVLFILLIIDWIIGE